MKSRKQNCFTSITLASLAIPVRLAAHHAKDHHKHHHYKLIGLGTFGPMSRNQRIDPALNNEGTVIGMADTSTPDAFKRRERRGAGRLYRDRAAVVGRSPGLALSRASATGGKTKWDLPGVRSVLWSTQFLICHRKSAANTWTKLVWIRR